ncbi:MAG TPA: hypothetical protein EYP36_09380 [Calditrichaeota bacterium]|nr:hypothetical protein [Calditrichota bacterium]
MYILVYGNKPSLPALPAEMIRLLTTGQAVFETILYSENQLWFWEKHEQRLLKTLTLFNATLQQEALKHSVLSFLRGRKIRTARVKLCFVFPFDQQPKQLSEEQALLQIEEIPEMNYGKQEAKLISKEFACSGDELLTGFKTINYGRRFYDLGRARQQGFDDVLYTDGEGWLLETAIANVFAVKGKNIYTPPEKNGVFPGIIRTLLIEYLNVREGKMHLDEVDGYDYLFLGNSIKELVFIEQINNKSFQRGTGHFDWLREKWEKIKSDYKKTNL